MPTRKLIARVETEEPGTFLVSSPAVGVADGGPDAGGYLNPLQSFLTLRILGRRHAVLLPRDVRGRVTDRFIEDTETPVAYDQPLFRLAQAAGPAAEEAVVAGEEGAEEGADADLIPVTSPSDGVFYRRPSPEAPDYVEEGSPVAKGTVLGLVEVMKFFNQISYGGPGLPEKGTVERVLVEDAAEVRFGETLFLIRPG